MGMSKSKMGYRVNNGQGERGIWIGTGRIGISGHGWVYRVPKWIKGAKVRTRNRKVIEMKQGSWKQEWDNKVGVSVWGCTECNSISLLDRAPRDLA